jgi:Arc/MetJ family transcription regulator
MRTAIKATKTFSLDKELLAEVKRTKGELSESERVNRLLRFALELEKRAALEREVAGFFSANREDRAERQAFDSASRTPWERE